MIVITSPQLKSTTWQTAFPKIKVISSDFENIDFSGNEIVWILSNAEDWKALVKKAVNQKKKVLVLSTSLSKEEFKQAFALGAHGYLDALTHPEGLKKVCESIENGAYWIPEDFIQEMIKFSSNKLNSTSETNKPELELLTNTERKVAKKVAEGESNKEVANDLNISERTVKSHLTSIYDKLSVRDRMHLMLLLKG